MASDTVIEAFDQAAKDPAIRAIIFRIDSPGGSPLAADSIWRGIEVAKQHGKPVIASMSNAAASGGYYVAGGADAIVASPGTITGSIGVIAIRPVIGKLLGDLGIGVELIKRGELADMFALTRPLSEQARMRFDDQTRVTYDLFLERVAAGRGMTTEQVDAIARGRVWTGAQAMQNGLVDSIGGLGEAVRIAKLKVGLDEQADVSLLAFPPPASFAEQIDEMFRQVAVRATRSAPMPGLFRTAQQWLGAAVWESPMLLPPFLVEIR